MARRPRQTQPPKPVEWNFRSFPVVWAFFLGAFIAVLLSPIGYLVFVVSLFATSFGVAHMIGHFFRTRTLDKEREQTEEQERERRALAAREARQAAAREGEPPPAPRRRRTRRR